MTSSVVLITALVAGNNTQSIKKSTTKLLFTKFLVTGKMKVKLFSEITVYLFDKEIFSCGFQNFVYNHQTYFSSTMFLIVSCLYSYGF